MANNKTHKPIIDIIPAASKKQAKPGWRPTAGRQTALLLAAVAILVLGGGFLLYRHYHQANNAKQAGGQSQIDDTVNKVSKLILLPSGEQPTLAIVNDASKYNNASFFKNAADGDRLLVYAQAHEAILYRPSINKIIAVAPLSVNSPSSSSSSSGSSTGQ